MKVHTDVMWCRTSCEHYQPCLNLNIIPGVPLQDETAPVHEQGQAYERNIQTSASGNAQFQSSFPQQKEGSSTNKQAFTSECVFSFDQPALELEQAKQCADHI
jgi:hypothetical protein